MKRIKLRFHRPKRLRSLHIRNNIPNMITSGNLLCGMLSAAGYHHYEISNWALPGHEAVHNSAYWTRRPYVGLGPGAHSLRICPDGRQVRSWNSKSISGWTVEGSEILTPEEIREEEIMLLSRTDKGPIPERDWFVADDIISGMI